MKRLAAAIALISLPFAQSAQAQGCLDGQTLAAARLHEFEAMMMTVSLRCRAIGVDISAGYEAMGTAHRPVFAAAGRHLRTFFGDERHAYDAYATRLGNRYGGGATDPANCHRFEAVARDLAAAPGVAALGKVAFAMVAEPRITGAACTKP
ncbi:MAG: hypothetical protein Q8R81_01205 [Novosphingobium sp.]|uniref:hypothetical protein n=1 Tax=Novosphingobium sp. TaxID=1874826 RepID=UPI00273559BF|nr:hypothetical protein [Novosphingobium sp.]MDP3548993.1 hypothetical protein [Novosphingobium sp.]